MEIILGIITGIVIITVIICLVETARMSDEEIEKAKEELEFIEDESDL